MVAVYLRIGKAMIMQSDQFMSGFPQRLFNLIVGHKINRSVQSAVHE